MVHGAMDGTHVEGVRGVGPTMYNKIIPLLSKTDSYTVRICFCIVSCQLCIHDSLYFYDSLSHGSHFTKIDHRMHGVNIY